LWFGGNLPCFLGRDSEQLSKLVVAYTNDHSLGNTDEISDDYLEAQQQAVFYATSECILKVEIDTIVDALGDDEGAKQPHSFKSSSFSIPTQCGYCKSSIWGLSKQGKTCKGCGLSVHAKCELKIPAECTHREGGRPRTSTTGSRISNASRFGDQQPAKPSSQPPTASSFVQSTETEESHPPARVLFDFQATSEYELDVSEGMLVHVYEEDDGSGWVKVADAKGIKGLVPTSYIEMINSEKSEQSDATSHSVQQGSGRYVRGLYEYEAQGSDELAVKRGELIELSGGPSGGQNYGDGWWEGINSKGQKGIFPSNYVEST